MNEDYIRQRGKGGRFRKFFNQMCVYFAIKNYFTIGSLECIGYQELVYVLFFYFDQVSMQINSVCYKYTQVKESNKNFIINF